MPDLSQVVHYDVIGVPLAVRKVRHSEDLEVQVPCHWHEDFEFVRVLKGEILYSVGEKTLLLQEGDGLFTNSRQMHDVRAFRGGDNIATCTLIHPDLVTSNPKLYEQYVKPLLSENALPYILISPSGEGYRKFADCLDEVWRLKDAARPGYEIAVIGYLPSLLAELSGRMAAPEEETTSLSVQKLAAQKKMVTFIAKNYDKPISLDDIAASADLSKSTCIRLFKTYAHQSPYNFLLDYRLQVACGLLTDTDKTVNEISAL